MLSRRGFSPLLSFSGGALNKLNQALVAVAKRRALIIEGCYPVLGGCSVVLLVLAVIVHFIVTIIERVRAW